MKQHQGSHQLPRDADDTSDIVSVMMTDLGTSTSQLGASSAVGNPDLTSWPNFSPEDLLPGHTVGMVYDPIASSAVVVLTEADAAAFDHCMEIAGIAHWMLEVTKQKEEQAQRLRRQRDEAIKHDELPRKIKADRLAAIQAAIQGKAGEPPHSSRRKDYFHRVINHHPVSSRIPRPRARQQVPLCRRV
jgi:hypothetical protein